MATTQNSRPRYGDMDDDEDDEYLSDDVPRPHGSKGADEDDEEEDEQTKQQRAADIAAAQALPANVKSFITSLRNAMSASNVSQIHNLYTSTFTRLTQEHYSQVEWPEVEVVSTLVEGNEVFGIFYKELYFRHIYSKLTPNIDDRFSSYENYCAIFNYILNSEGPVPLDLPVQWLWDLVDEFVWQFSSFSIWRSRPKNKTQDEIALLAENPQVWSCYSVLNVLYSLIQKSKILDQLRLVKKGESQEAVDETAGEYGARNLYKMLGLYSVITLVRVHALLGDYTLALKMLDEVDLKKLPTRDVPAAHVSLHYHIGYSYLMMQRYSDAIYHLSRGYLFFAGPKRGRAQSAGGDAVAKQADRMLALLAIAHALSPSKWEDTREVREAREALRSNEKYNEQFEVLSNGGESSLPLFEELFRFGAPKSISPQTPPYHDVALLDNVSDPFQHTVTAFLDAIKPSLNVGDLRTLLKLYTSIGTEKLAKLAGKEEKELVRELMLLKGNLKTVRWTETPSGSTGGLLNQEEVLGGNIGFAVEGSTIGVTEQRRARQFTGRFLAQGLVAKQVLDQLKARPLPAPVFAGGAAQVSSQNTTSSANALQQQDKANTRPQPPAGIMQGQGKSVAWVK